MRPPTRRGASHEHRGASQEHGGVEIEYPLSQVKSDSEGHGSSTTTLRETSAEKLFSGDHRHVNVHEAGTPPAHPDLRRPERSGLASRRVALCTERPREAV